MVSITIRVNNLTRAVDLVRQISLSGEAWGKTRIRAGSPLAYARGIETGVRRNGVIARKAGGAFMFKKGIEKLKNTIRAELATAALMGPPGIAALARKASSQLVGFVQEETPVVSGDLRASVFAGTE
jgi:hypothetical protein